MKRHKNKTQKSRLEFDTKKDYESGMSVKMPVHVFQNESLNGENKPCCGTWVVTMVNNYGNHVGGYANLNSYSL